MNRCANGCHTRPDTDGNRRPVLAEPPSQLCRACEDRLLSWLEKIPENYLLLPAFLEPGSVDGNPESKSTKAANPPLPVRVEVLDLLDTRRGRRWLGTEAAEDRRGVLGTLESWARMVREEHPGGLATPVDAATVAGEAAFLRRHLLWCAEQPWVDELYAEVKALHRDLADAVGDYRPRPVGRCETVTEDGDCGGTLLPSRWGMGVHCPRCGAQWTQDDLQRLGMVIGGKA
jgi:hypothetical protein